MLYRVIAPYVDYYTLSYSFHRMLNNGKNTKTPILSIKFLASLIYYTLLHLYIINSFMFSSASKWYFFKKKIGRQARPLPRGATAY